MPANMIVNFGLSTNGPLHEGPPESWPQAAQAALSDRLDALWEAAEPGVGREALQAFGELCCLHAALDWEWPSPFPVYVAEPPYSREYVLGTLLGPEQGYYPDGC